MAQEHILIVEDEEKIATVLQDYLAQSGFRTSILARGDRVLPFFKDKTPDLILLDIMLPGMDGMEVCREIRKISPIPIIMLTARIEEIDRLLGLELGADDYICKPFSPREVVARVKAVLRRANPVAAPEVITRGPLVLNEATRQASVDGQELKLTPSEFKLLQTMMSHPKRVFSRSDLVTLVQGYEYDGYERTIDTHIKNLRKKIATHCPEREIIGSVYGQGYRFIAE